MSGCCCSGDPNYNYPERFSNSDCLPWPPNSVRVFAGETDRLYSTRSVWRCGQWYWSWPPYGAGPQTYNTTLIPNRNRDNFESKYMFGQMGSVVTPS